MDLQVVTLVVGGVALIWAMTCLPDLGVVIAKKIRANLPTSERTCGNCGQSFDLEDPPCSACGDLNVSVFCPKWLAVSALVATFVCLISVYFPIYGPPIPSAMAIGIWPFIVALLFWVIVQATEKAGPSQRRPRRPY